MTDQERLAIAPPQEREDGWSQICGLILAVIVLSAGAALSGSIDNASKKSAEDNARAEHVENDPRSMVAAAKQPEAMICESPARQEK